MKVRELLTDKSKWTKRAFARTKEGGATNVSDTNATCFCLVGALLKCYNDDNEFSYNLNRLNMVVIKLGTPSISLWNDSPNRTFEEVKQLVEELDI